MKNSKLMVTFSTFAISFGAINTVQAGCKPKPFSGYIKIKRLLVITLIIPSLTACIMGVDRYKAQKISYAYEVNESIDKNLLSLKHADNDTIQYDKERDTCGALLAIGGFLPFPLLYPCHTYSEVQFENGKPVMLAKVTIQKSGYLCGIEALFATNFKSVCAGIHW
jgi:hypothetical protein